MTKFSIRRFEAELVVSAIFVLEILIVHHLSDLPIEVTNWSYKAKEILSLNVPSDNFYGPGAAILMAPFVLINREFLAILVYAFLGAWFYVKIVKLLPTNRYMVFGYFALISNVYLIWLINSSQDTVFEFFLLILTTYLYLKKHFLGYSGAFFLLSLTRSAYWLPFLLVGLYELYKFVRSKEFNYKKALAIPLLLLTGIFNFVNYDSPSPALEGGITAYFSYSKYHFLSLPKMDMDVFLSGEAGIFSEKYGVIPQNDLSPADENNVYMQAAIDSAVSNPKQTLLGWMQKIDSYIFVSQKVPNLPGSYVLNQGNKTIEIGDERLNWILILGNLVFMFWRASLLIVGLIALGIWISIRKVGAKCDLRLSFLSFPWLIGLIPGVLFYTETRFKIVSEALLFPLILEVLILGSLIFKRIRLT